MSPTPGDDGDGASQHGDGDGDWRSPKHAANFGGSKKETLQMVGLQTRDASSHLRRTGSYRWRKSWCPSDSDLGLSWSMDLLAASRQWCVSARIGLQKPKSLGGETW